MYATLLSIGRKREPLSYFLLNEFATNFNQGMLLPFDQCNILVVGVLEESIRWHSRVGNDIHVRC